MSIEKISECLTSATNKIQIADTPKIGSNIAFQNIKSPLNSINLPNINLPTTTVDVFEKQGKKGFSFMQFLKAAVNELFNK